MQPAARVRPGSILVDVVDAASGDALADIALELRPRPHHRDGGPQARVTRVRSKSCEISDSPVEIQRSCFPEESEHSALWIGAPGRAWVRIEEPPAGIDRLAVQLQLASAVLVTVRGKRSTDKLSIQMCDEAGQLLAEQDADANAAQFEGLLPGPHLVRVVAKTGGRLHLAEGRVECVPGGCARIVLALHANDEGERGTLAVDWTGSELTNWIAETPLRATIRPDMPREAHTRSGTLYVISAVKQLGSNALGVPHHEQIAGGLPPGRYRIELEPLGIRRLIDVLPGQTTRTTVAIPPLARTVVTFVDARTGAEVFPRRLSAVLRSEGNAVKLVPLDRPAEGGAIQFVCEPGELSLDCQDDIYACVTHAVHPVSAGSNAITVDVVPAARLELVWKQEDVDPSVDVAATVIVRSPDGRSALLGMTQLVGAAGGGESVELRVPAAVPLSVTIPSTSRCSECRLTLELQAGANERRTIVCSH